MSFNLQTLLVLVIFASLQHTPNQVKTSYSLSSGLLVCYDPSSLEQSLSGSDPVALQRELALLETSNPTHVFPLLGCRSSVFCILS
jgi:hypothetical protein